MPNCKRLLQKLKASDRRRQRRSGANPHQASTHSDRCDSTPNRQASAASKVATDGPDIAELVVRRILEDTSRLTDAAVIAAIRGSLKGTSPENANSQSLRDRFDEIVNRSDVDFPAYRRALEQLLDLATQHRDPKQQTAFIRYLSLLAE